MNHDRSSRGSLIRLSGEQTRHGGNRLLPSQRQGNEDRPTQKESNIDAVVPARAYERRSRALSAALRRRPHRAATRRTPEPDPGSDAVACGLARVGLTGSFQTTTSSSPTRSMPRCVRLETSSQTLTRRVAVLAQRNTALRLDSVRRASSSSAIADARRWRSPRDDARCVLRASPSRLDSIPRFFLEGLESIEYGRSCAAASSTRCDPGSSVGDRLGRLLVPDHADQACQLIADSITLRHFRSYEARSSSTFAGGPHARRGGKWRRQDEPARGRPRRYAGLLAARTLSRAG